MQEDLRSVTFVCTDMLGETFEVDDVNLVNAPMGEEHFWVDDRECSHVSVNGIDLRAITFIGMGAHDSVLPENGVNSISFNESEGIYYIDNIPCRWVKPHFELSIL